MYEIYLLTEDIEHTESVFEEFLKAYGKDLCPHHGDLIYVDGGVKCNEHTEESERNNKVANVVELLQNGYKVNHSINRIRKSVEIYINIATFILHRF